MIPAQTINTIFETARIEEVIGDFVELKKAGANFKGLSPFKQEKTPSFVVSPSKQIFKCFSTGKGGNVVSFLMEHEQMSYPEALRYLAKRYQIEIEEKEDTDEQREARQKRESLAVAMKFAQDFFQEQLLQTDKGKSVALSYFTERGIDIRQIEKFKLGWCPDSGKALADAAKAKGFNLNVLVELGLLKKYGENQYKDFYSGRVIFPISNITGQAVAFAGRVLQSHTKAPKYINSPETELYHKSKVLYGVHQARTSIAKEDRCYLTEGYTDVLALERAGVENAVASSGTALTKEQAYLIRRYSKNVCLLYDGDEAGQKAAMRGIDILLEQGLTVELLTLPNNHDPDSFLKSEGADALKSYLETNRLSFIEYKAKVFLEGVNDPIKRSEGIRNIVDSLSKIEDQLLRSLYVKQCADKYQLDENIIAKEIGKKRKKAYFSDKPGSSLEDREQVDFAKPTNNLLSKVDPFDMLPIEEEILRLLLLYGQDTFEYKFKDENDQVQSSEYLVSDFILETLKAEESDFSSPFHQKLLAALKENPKLDIPVFMGQLNKDEQGKLSAWLATEHAISDHWYKKHQIDTSNEQKLLNKAIPETLHAYLLRKAKWEIKIIQDELKNNPDFEEVERLLEKQARYHEAKKIYAKFLERVVLH